MDKDATAAPRGVIRKIRAAYSLALALTGILIAATFFLLNDTIRSHQTASGLQYLASQQQILAQRIETLARSGAGADKAALAQALDQIEQNLAQLESHAANGSPASANRWFEGAATAVLTSEPWRVAEATRALAAAGRSMIDGQSVGTARPVDPALVDAVVTGYAVLSEKFAMELAYNVERTSVLQQALFAATLLILALEALLIFRPLTRQVAERTQELIASRNSMAFLAAHDGLTGLRNRAFLTDHFETLIETARRRRDRIAVIHLDLDHFKDINDTFGHAAGDYVLAEIARRLKECTRSSDICARLGGDEFVVVLTSIGTTSDIADVTHRVLNTVNRPIMFEGTTLIAGASAGIAVFPEDARSPEELLIHADLALYRAKEEGRGRARFFSEELRREHENRKALEADLREAIHNTDFTVNYQPQISLENSRVVGIEALVRWSTPERGPIPPSEFIPTAEKAGLMDAIGRIIIRKAIHQAAQWHSMGIDFGRLAVNASASELQSESFVDFLLNSIAEVALPAEKLSVEIVESVILDDDRTGVISRLKRLRAAGVHLELDDFGTGYSSLSRVNANEIDRLKIDKRFIHNINSQPDNSRIVRAIVELGKGLGISIVAEGAETQAELETLRQLGCTNAQGFGIAFPMGAEEATDWLSIHAQKASRGTVLRLEKRVV